MQPPMAEHIPHGLIHDWFGLSYAAYLVINRSVLQSMPLDWQERFVGCLRELHESFGNLEDPSYNVQCLRREQELIFVPEPCWKCGGEGVLLEPCGDVDIAEECDECDGSGGVADTGEHRYETPEEVGFRLDPIPHYNRGRTRIEPTGPFDARTATL